MDEHTTIEVGYFVNLSNVCTKPILTVSLFLAIDGFLLEGAIHHASREGHSEVVRCALSCQFCTPRITSDGRATLLMVTGWPLECY